MIAGAQTVVVPSRTRRVTAICEACLDQQSGPFDGYLGATVSASLPLEHDHGSVTCSRGHEIRILRARRVEDQCSPASAEHSWLLS
jgi:hypothetical protein